MNDPQIWTLIAAFVGSQGLTLALTMHRIGSLEIKLEANAGFDHHAEVMSIRFGAVEQRVGALDDDMKLVKAHLIPPAA